MTQDEQFLHQLKQIVLENLNNEQFGVEILSKSVGVSRSHLHRRLKKLKGLSISQFIREIRLEEALKLLQEDVFTTAEIAYKVGFNSSSYFHKCFHSRFGYPPSEVKKIFNKGEIRQGLRNQPNAYTKNVKTKKKRISQMVVFAVALLFVGYWSFYNFAKKKVSTPIEKSIAVLPLKNVTNNEAIQHLADGIMEDILNRLSHVQELKVKSRISSEHFKNPDMTLPKIAKEMDVSYILEGSIINNGDKVRIYVQLIDANNDDHIWSDEYNQDLTDIFEFTTDVSKQIAEELQVALTQGEIASVEKNYTENTEAYNLYLLGRYFWHRRTKEDLDKCIKYFNQAIALDSTFALAYAGLSDTYNSLSGNGWYPFDEGIQKCRDYAMKAISLDYNLAEGHASLGDCLSDYYWDWENAEKELKLAIQLNPNFALAYKYYAGYLTIIGKNKDARKIINKGIELYPQSLPMYQQSAWSYYAEGNFDEALKENNKILAFWKDWGVYWNKFCIYIHQGKNVEAIQEMQNFLILEEHNMNFSKQLNQIYSQSGMTGIIEWLIEHYLAKKSWYYLNNEKSDEYFVLAYLYAFNGNKDKSVEYLERIYNSWRKRSLSQIKNNPDFKILHDDSRFIALLEKMNLTLKSEVDN